MRINIVLATALLATGMTSVQAGTYYDPTNAASPSGKTVGYELFGTIGCPGKQLFDKSCPIPPKDSDGDGVTDDKDQCPTTPAGRKVDARGCELDGDKDGVVDALDQCPTTPAGRKVDAKGCEIDSDGDGLVDGDDRCPTVFAKTADGCPVPAPAPVPEKLVLEGVNFDNDKAVIRAEDMPTLDAAAETLKKWGDAKVEVAGHTDDQASDDYNQALSQKRAQAVVDYLVGKGIAAERLSAKGYGESKPVADNATAEGRFKNRRVELVPMQ